MPATATIIARKVNGKVKFYPQGDSFSTHLNGWRYTIDENDPETVVFHLEPDDGGSCERVVQSFLLEDGERVGSGAAWPLQGSVHVSGEFRDGDDVEVEVTLCNGSSTGPTGSGYFYVRDAGGGGNLVDGEDDGDD